MVNYLGFKRFFRKYQIDFQLITQFMEKGKFTEALKQLDSFLTRRIISSKNKATCLIYKANICKHTGDLPKAIIQAEEAFKLAKKRRKKLLMIDALLILAEIFNNQMILDKAKSSIDHSEQLLLQLPNTNETKLKKAKLDIIKNQHLYLIGSHNFNEMAVIGEESNKILGQLGNTFEKSFGLFYLGYVYASIGNLMKGLDLLKESVEKGGTISPLYRIHIFTGFGVVYLRMGYLDLALKYNIQAIELAKQIEVDMIVLGIVNNTASIYWEKGDFTKAMEYLEQAKLYSQKSGNPSFLLTIFVNIIELATQLNDKQKQCEYLDKLRNIKDQSPVQEIIFQYAKAITLRGSLKAKDRVEAEQLFRSVIQGEVISPQYYIFSILRLCDLLLVEFKISKDVTILEEAKELINKLQAFAKNNFIQPLLARTYLLKAQFELIEFNLKQARILLVKAQEIAETNGLKALAMQISNERDQLLTKLDVWKSMKKESVSLFHRLDNSNLTTHIAQLLRKMPRESINLENEEPILLTIMKKEGPTVFTHPFINEWKVNSQLFGGFLSAFNSFSGEFFSTSVDRARFGEYTLLMYSLTPFILCYVIKGNSYVAQKRLELFAETIQQHIDLWEDILQTARLNNTILLDQFPRLKDLINEIFDECSIEEFITLE